MVVKKKKQTEDEDEGVSAAPSDQVAGGGLLSDVDVEFAEVSCTTFDYNGKVKDKDGNVVEVPAILIKMVTDEGEEADQYLTAGDLDKLVPSEDGSRFVPADGSTMKGIPAKSNAGIFFRSLGDAGFPFTHDEGLPEDYSPRNIVQLLQGMRAHILRIEAPKRGNLATSERKKKYPDEVLTVTEVKRLPWEPKKKAGKAAAAPAKAGKKAAKVEEDEDEDEVDVTAEAVEVVTGLLNSPKHKKGISTDEIAELVFAATKTNPNRKAIIAEIQSKNWFENADEFELDEDGTITLA